MNKEYLSVLHNNLFPKIESGQVILFLGAGASVTTTSKFLSWEIIKNYSQAVGADFETTDIIEFVDMLSENIKYSRNHFDNFVREMLERIKPTDTHKTLVTLPWKEIITTNLDLVIEKAFLEVQQTPLARYRIHPIRQLKDATYVPQNDEIRYVKLHGCISDPSNYPFVFSTADFKRTNKFYQEILSRIKNIGTNVELLTIGYSFTDEFAKKMLEKFDSHARTSRKWIYHVDPYIPEDRKPFLLRNKIQPLPLSSEEFFTIYKVWKEEQDVDVINRKKIVFYDVENHKMTIPSYLLLQIGNDLKQLDPKHKNSFIDPKEFYRYSEPTYEVIQQELDVVRTDLLNDSINVIEKALNDDIFVPIILITGSWGRGKSTFIYRLINEAISKPEWKAIALEVGDPRRLTLPILEEFFTKTQSKTVFLLMEKIESDSSYKYFRELQARLSVGQFAQFKVVLLGSIRSNIYEKFHSNNPLQDVYEINTDKPLTESEALSLITKLEKYNLVNFKDAQERNSKVRTIISDYKGDLLVSLISLVPESEHNRIIDDAVEQLPASAKKALIYIALFYRYQINMPTGFLRSLMGIDWDDFGESVLYVDFKGIVDREISNHQGISSDDNLFIRHQIIAEHIVNRFHTNEDSLFKQYKEIINKIENNSENSLLITDLLKAIRQYSHLNQEKINKLFDIAAQKLGDDAHFCLHYTMNLERRGTKQAIEKGLRQLIYVISLTNDNNNHRLIHRRAALTARLGRILYNEDKNSHLAMSYFREAEAWFDRKRILDPYSHYSYENYLEFEIWCLKNLKFSEEEILYRKIKIQDLFEQSESLITTTLDRVHELKINNSYYLYGSHDDENYIKEIEKGCNSESLKPLSLTLQFYYYFAKSDWFSCEQIIQLLEGFTEHDYVVDAVFRYYTIKLYNPDFRVKFLELTKKHPELENRQTLRFLFYLFVAYIYNWNFKDAFEVHKILNKKYRFFRTELHEVWKDSVGTTKVFEGVIEKNKKLTVYLPDFQKSFPLRLGKINQDIKDNEYCLVNLYIHPYGIRTVLKEIVKTESN